MQHGLAQWLAFLSNKPLPILNRTKIDVQGLIDQAQLSITQYTSPVLFDAGFSAYLFSHVNKQRVAAGRNPLTTLDNALSHLGQGAFQAVLDNAPLLEELKLSEKNTQGYMRAMAMSCHAALQAKNWAQHRGVMQPEEAQLATLLQNITELLLWCYGDNAMPEIESLCYVKKKNYEDAAKMVLGCGMRELGSAIAESINLPELAVAGLRSRQDDFTLATGVSLASELARVVSLNWYGKQATDIIQRIARYQAKAEGEIEHRLHMYAVNMTQQLVDKDYIPPASLLPLLADDAYVDPQFIFQDEKLKTQETAEPVVSSAVRKSSPAEKQTKEVSRVPRSRPVTSKKPDDSRADISGTVNKVQASSSVSENKKADTDVKKKAAVSSALAAAIKVFQKMVMQGRPAHELIESAVKACLLCGVQRCVFLIKVPTSNSLVSRYIEQSSGEVEIKRFKIPLNHPHVFSLLMEKNRNLFLNKENASKYWKHIPDSVKLSIGVKQFFATSIFANNHAMGLMYADKVKGDLTQAEFVQFQGVCRLLSKGIVQSAHNKKK